MGNVHRRACWVRGCGTEDLPKTLRHKALDMSATIHSTSKLLETIVATRVSQHDVALCESNGRHNA
jgi:hypothetical protein